MTQAHYRFKSAALDPSQLRRAYGSAEIGDDASSVTFKTPGGHSVSTPFSNEVVSNQMSRLGGKSQYYDALGRALREQAKGVDRKIESDRDDIVAQRRAGAVLGRGTLGAIGGGLVGYLLGGLANSPGVGAALGGTLGGLAGGYAGTKSKVQRPSGSEHRDLREVAELYKEPEHVKRMREQMDEMQDHVETIRRRQVYDAYRRDYRDPYSDPFSPYYDPMYPYRSRRRYLYGY